ncbi:MAG: nucleoid-associated protein YejK [Gammaproteobacteria bacterium]|nr:nucleoid-associated protein YejK [Gammaproteobacteria bacterium]
MPIQNCVIHYLEKKPDDSPARLQAAAQPLAIDNALEALLVDFNEHYNAKPGKSWACFVDDSQTLPAGLKALAAGELDFQQLGLQLAQHWQKLLDDQQIYLAGHLCLMLYQFNMADHCVVALLPQRHGLRIGDSLAPEDIQHLDLSQLQLACRINLSEWRNNASSKHYISLLKGKGGKKLADAFLELLHADEHGDAPADTRTLLRAFSDYIDTTGLDEEPVQEKTRALVQYTKEQQRKGEPVALEGLSEALDEDNPRAFYEHIRNLDYGLSDYVPTDRKVINQFQRFTGRAEGLSISFEAHLLGSRVEYDEQRDMLIIRQLPTQLKDQLKRSS